MDISTHLPIVEVLYFKCYEASLLNHMELMKTYFSFLEQEYSKCPETFKQFINEDRYAELNKIKYQVETNTFIEQYSNFEPIEQEIALTDTEAESEFDVVKAVYKDPTQFEEFLSPNLQRKGIEFRLKGKKTTERCDLVFQGGKILYPIEFKLKKATHAVVGQIDKYCLKFKLRLINRTFNKVQGVVVANSYSQYAANELKKRGYVGIIHSGPVEALRFKRLF